MKKLIIYKSGERYLMDGMSISLHQGEVDQEVDLTQATKEEMAVLKQNPHNDTLISAIQMRKKGV